MNLLNTQNRINELLTQFVTEVKGFTAMGRSDINRVAETMLIPLFAEIYGYQDLKNLNYIQANYPSIDLADDVAKVVIQVTSTPDSKKIKHTLETFIKHKFYEKYDRLIIYIITEKQNRYSGNGFKEILQDKLVFNIESDIQDYQTILKEVSNFQIDKAEKIRLILEKNFSNAQKSYLLHPLSDKKTETVTLNLLEIYFPDKLYVADVSLKRDQVIEKSHDLKYKVKLNQKSNWRSVIRAALEQKGLKFSSDWICHGCQIITFHDLNNYELPLRSVINLSTIKAINTKEYYAENSDQKRVFKMLLNSCLQQQLYHRGINWQNEEKLFIFSLLKNPEERTESWLGEKNNTRNVCKKIMKKTKPDELLHYRHFGFRTEYKQFAERWYIVLKPEWFFSFDGYKKSFYHKDSLSWLKRQENNKKLYDDLRFIVYFLKNKPESPLFSFDQKLSSTKIFLSFGELISFDNSPYLNDQQWLHKPTTEKSPETHEQLKLF